MSRGDWRFTILPAQPGWELVEVTWRDWNNPLSWSVTHRGPVVAWQIESEVWKEASGDRDNMLSRPVPIWVGGHYFGEWEHQTLISPEGYVCYGNEQFDSIIDYALWAALTENDLWKDKVKALAWAERHKDEIRMTGLQSRTAKLVESWKREEVKEAAE
jgi:hypothetical protein